MSIVHAQPTVFGVGVTMRRKVLQDFANVLCQMFVGWRLHIADDPQRLAQLVHGMVSIDVLTTMCHYNGNDIPPLTIAQELHSWLIEHLYKQAIPLAAIQEAQLNIVFQVEIEHQKHRRIRRMQFMCHSQIATDDKIYQSELQTTDTGIRLLPKRGRSICDVPEVE